MKTLDELDRLHAAATAGEWESVLCDAPHVNDEVRMIEGPVTRANGRKFVPVISRISPRADADCIVALHNAWPGISARLRAAEVDAHNLRVMLGRALDDWRDAKAEVERLRGALRGMLAAFDGAHDIDCTARGAHDTEVCRCDDGCAEPHCECGATRSRGIALAALEEP